MEFSEDSFVWSYASNDSDTMEFDIKQEDSDNNRDNLVEDKSHRQKKKAKKRKYEEPKEINGTVDSKPELIKSEQSDSDIDTSRKKKKKKHHNSNEELQVSDYDESYLNYKVKQEQVSFLEPTPVKTKNKKKHKKNSESLTEDLENTSQEVDTSKLSESSQIDDKLNVEEEEHVEKKKKKKNKKNTSDTIALNDDFDNSADNFKAKKKLKKKHHENEIISKSFDKSDDSQIEEISCINSSTLNNNFIDDDQFKENSNSDLNNESTATESKIDYPVTSNAEPSRQIPKILERLRFEDEDTIDSEPKGITNEEETSLSKHLKIFLDANKKLSLITPKAQIASVITEDDEIWIINSPHEVNVKDFKGKHIKLDTKCKLKFNGQFYDSVIDNCITKAPILSYNKNKSYVKNFPIINSINLRKRIPKAHIPEENVITNNQINFIPLPETKCRHPLFGINYRKASKIAPSINERLNNTVTESSNSDKEKKKKRKKEKRKVEIESDVETKPLTETIPMESAKKKRKRKSSTKDEHVAKKAKYIKNEQDSTDVWDSEQAIEKNLFDF